MHCVNCGNEIKEGQKYCGKCGTKVSNNNTLDNQNISDTKNIGLFEKFKKLVLITLIIGILSFIIVAITSSGETIIWNISKIVFFISLALYCIGIIACTIISKKNKMKLKGWLGMVQTITIAIVIAAIVIFIISKLINRNSDKNLEINTIKVGLTLSFNNCEAEYIDKYKDCYIYKVILSSGEKYYVGAYSNDNYITKNASKYYTETEDRIVYTDANKSILTIYKTKDSSGNILSTRRMYITLFEYKNDLINCIENQ